MLSQDPYPYGQAHGLAFSTTQEETPFSLRMIFRELDRDLIKTTNYKEYKQAFPTNNLTKWAERGVLLLNTILTVRSEQTNSHAEIGWKPFTREIIKQLYWQNNPIAFVLWGSEAKKEFVLAKDGLHNDHHLILEGGHPASGSHGKDKFSGNSHFSKINHWLKKQNVDEINWRLNG